MIIVLPLLSKYIIQKRKLSKNKKSPLPYKEEREAWMNTGSNL